MQIPPHPLPGDSSGPRAERCAREVELSSLPPAQAGSVPSDVYTALTYGLELARCGAVLVGESGQPHIANQTARAILQKKDGLSLAQNGIVADRASDTRLLQQLVRDAIVAPEAGEPKESPFVVERKTAHSSLIVRVVPGPGLGCWQSRGQKTALLKLYDRDMGVIVDERALISLYGLTRGEAALTAKLIQGKSPEEAASELFISAHTARTHLKRVFMKTDCHRQPELVVRMLLTVL